MKSLSIMALILFGFVIAIHAQNDQLKKAIREQLNPEAIKKIEKAEKYFKKAENETKLAEQLMSSREKKALQKQISASRSLGKANRISYKVYKNDLKKLDALSHDSIKTMKKKLARASRLMKQATRKREDAMKMNVPENMYSLLKHSDEIENKAFKELFAIYGLLITDAETSLGKKSSLKEQNIKPLDEEKILTNEETVRSDENISVATDNEIVPVVNSNEKLKIENISSDIKKEQNLNELSEKEPNGKVYFKIQIAASKTQLTVEQLEKNYKTKEVLNVEKDGEWYKYSIRKMFTDYNEALAYKNGLQVKGAFIIAFKNGKKVTIEEALRKDDPIEQNKDENVVKETMLPVQTDEKITYRLQVGFSINRLSAEEIKEFKTAGNPVEVVDCGSWFIYTIGDFSTENDANRFKKLKSLTDAEVVKMKNGKPIVE